MNHTLSTPATPTLILTRSDVEELLSLRDCIAVVERAFRLHAEGQSLGPGVLGISSGSGGFHIKAAGLRLSRPYFAAKANANFSDNPARHGLPAIQGVIVLSDAENGVPLAVMDSIAITALRTAAATAVAARYLARVDARIATVCGCGTQGDLQLRALACVCHLDRAFTFDADPARAEAMASRLAAELDLQIAPVTDLVRATRQSQVIVTCTPSRSPLLRRGDAEPGTFIAAVGADSHDKQELEPSLVAAAALIVDHVEQCATIGELHHAIEAGLMSREEVRAELSDVVAGRREGRRTDQEIVIFDSTGTALQDVAAAAAVYERALAVGRGLAVELG
jgi:alanine dehydrogenase